MSLDDVLGQDAAVSVLRSAIARGRVASAYLFHGPDAVGKRMAALGFAGALLCPDGKSRLDACGTCPSCVRREAGSHPGLILLTRKTLIPPGDPKERTKIGIKQVHEFGRLLSLKPPEGERTVGIMDDAEGSSIDALNALLKTLEEPRSGATIVLVSGNREQLPDTIRSRCQGVRFRPLPPEILCEVLVGSLGVPEAEGRELAAIAGGSVSRAIRIREMGLLEGQEVIASLLSGEERDPVEVAEGVVALVSGGSLQETRMRTREVLLVLMERARRRFLVAEGGRREPESARICFDGIRRAVDNLGRNVGPAVLLKALIIEILPAWNLKRTTPRG